MTGNDQSRMVALARQSEIALWSGDTDEAIRSAQEAAGLATPFTDWLAAAAEGTLAIVRGLADNPGGRLRNYPDSYRGIKLTSRELQVARPVADGQTVGSGASSTRS